MPQEIKKRLSLTSPESYSWQKIMLGLLILLGITSFGVILGVLLAGYRMKENNFWDETADKNTLEEPNAGLESFTTIRPAAALPPEDCFLEQTGPFPKPMRPTPFKKMCTQVAKELGPAQNLPPNFTGFKVEPGQNDQQYYVNPLSEPQPSKSQWDEYLLSTAQLSERQEAIQSIMLQHYQESMTRLIQCYVGQNIDAETQPVIDFLMDLIRLYYARMMSNCVGQTSELRYRMWKEKGFDPLTAHTIPAELNRYTWNNATHHENHDVALEDGNLCDVWNKGKYCTISEVREDKNDCGIYKSHFWPMIAHYRTFPLLPPESQKYVPFLRKEIADMDKHAERLMSGQNIPTMKLAR